MWATSQEAGKGKEMDSPRYLQKKTQLYQLFWTYDPEIEEDKLDYFKPLSSW